jgi:hypothetical protein
VTSSLDEGGVSIRGCAGTIPGVKADPAARQERLQTQPTAQLDSLARQLHGMLRLFADDQGRQAGL